MSFEDEHGMGDKKGGLKSFMNKKLFGKRRKIKKTTIGAKK